MGYAEVEYLKDQQRELGDVGVSLEKGMSACMRPFAYSRESQSAYYVRGTHLQRVDIFPGEDVGEVVDHHARWMDTGEGPEYPVRLVKSVGVED